MDNIVEKNLTVLPMLTLRGVVPFPNVSLSFEVARKKSVIALNHAMQNNQHIYLLPQKDDEIEVPILSDLAKVGVVCKIQEITRGNKDSINVVVEGLYRATIDNCIHEEPFFMVELKPCKEIDIKGKANKQAAYRVVMDMFLEYIEQSGTGLDEVSQLTAKEEEVGMLCDYIVANLAFESSSAQPFLDELNINKRMNALMTKLIGEIEIATLENEIQTKVREQIDKGQREYYLREQIKVIADELNEGDSPAKESQEYLDKIKALKIADKDIEEKLIKECNRLNKMPSGAQESNVIRTYLDNCIELPWNKSTKETIDLTQAQKVLDKDHYGLEKLKERIVEMLAVRKLNPNINGQIICLVGPPGVGKTSIARSIAKAINRNYARISLGGVRDESDIRGHRKTYIGAMPGRIVDALQQAKSNNPLILLDEIDKLGSDYHGDPASALLELLDSEQNSTFYDHYIDLPFDMSKAMFITTANDYSSIPSPLLDRMEIIEFSSYTASEKLQIAKKHLLPKQLKKHGLLKKQLKINDDTLKALISGYTKEAGVRTLERTLAKVCRKVAIAVVQDENAVLKITKDNIEDYLGAIKFKPDVMSGKDEIGVTNGLAWTSVGGEILPVEVAVMQGTGKIELTGSLGDVMKESAKTAITCVRSYAKQLAINADFYKDTDIHIHVPEGAVPKDGPSAGVTMATAIVSALKGIEVKHNVAMTGEITLRGRVLPIGGLKEKAMAAYQNGMKTVLIPKENEPNLEDVDDIVKQNVKFIPVASLTEALSGALAISEDKNIADIIPVDETFLEFNAQSKG